MPAIFFGHGNPMYAIEPYRYSDAWRRLGESLPRPAAVLAVSAHWYTRGTAVTTMAQPRTLHDFGGFPRALFEVQYPAPGSPPLARRVQQLLAPTAVHLDEDATRGWGLDHGTWSVLTHVFPEADVPVVQLSIDGTQPPAWHDAMARRLAPLRDDGHESAPTPELYLPLLYVIAQLQAGESVTFPGEGIDMGAIDMRTVALI